MKNIDSNPLLSTLWRIIRLHYEKSKNSFSLPSIFKSIPKNCQGSHERIFCIQFPRLASLFFFHVTFVSLSLSILPNRIIPSSRERDGVTPRTVSRKFRAKHFGDTPGDNDMTPAYMTFDGNIWRCLTDARQIIISAHQIHVHGFKDRIKTSRSRGLFVCSFFVG